MPVQVSITPIELKKRDFPTAKWKQAESAIEHYLVNRLKQKVKKYMRDRVRNWDTPITFVGIISKAGGSVAALTVFPRGSGREVWEWVSLGTRAHTITATRAPVLRYRVYYDPHTSPGNKYDGTGKHSGPYRNPPPVTVTHTGIEPRNFEENIIKHDLKENEIARELAQIISNALR